MKTLLLLGFCWWSSGLFSTTVPSDNAHPFTAFPYSSNFKFSEGSPTSQTDDTVLSMASQASLSDNAQPFTVFPYSLNFKFSEDLPLSETDDTVLTIKFHKVVKSFKEGSTANMTLRYNASTQTAWLQYSVPSYIFRLKTTLADYCIVETSTQRITLRNKEENTSTGKDIVSYYNFGFELSKDSLVKIFSDDLKKISFYFTPNPEIERYLSKNTYINDSYDKLSMRNANKTIIYTISKPEKEQYEGFRKWLSKL